MIVKFDMSTQLARVVVVVSLVGLVMLIECGGMIECGGSSGDEEIDCEPSNSCDNSMILHSRTASMEVFLEPCMKLPQTSLTKIYTTYPTVGSYV